MESNVTKIIDIDKLIMDNNHKVSKNLQRWQKLQELIKEEITLNEKSKEKKCFITKIHKILNHKTIKNQQIILLFFFYYNV